MTYNIDDNWQVQATYGQYSSRFNDNVAGNVTGVGGAPLIESLYTGPVATGPGLRRGPGDHPRRRQLGL